MRVLCKCDVLEIDGEVYHHHPKGGGLVSKTAHVAEAAYIAVRKSRYPATPRYWIVCGSRALCTSPGTPSLKMMCVLAITCSFGAGLRPLDTQSIPRMYRWRVIRRSVGMYGFPETFLSQAILGFPEQDACPEVVCSMTRKSYFQ